MKIGILTYHRSHNYGALLQAIALRKVLSDMGHVVTFIDYWPAYHRHMYETISISSMKYRGIRKNWEYIVTCLSNYFYRKERISNFNKFIAKFILPHISSTEDNYDLVIYGSDQIWRKQPEIKTYNPVYFGKNRIKAKKHISYAASMGILPRNETDKLLISELLKHLDKISVRESDLAQLIKKLGYACHHHLDPVFLLNKGNWQSVLPAKNSSDEKYILYYCLQKDAFNIYEVKEFAKKRNLKIKYLYGTAIKKNTKNEITTADPLMFIDLIKNAEFVITSSYHGLAFSILFHKPFYVAFSRNSKRASSLLSQLGLSIYLIPPCSSIPSHYPPIDYNQVDFHLNMLRKDSKQYLNDATK